MKKITILTCAVAVAFFSQLPLSQAHEFILKPVNLTAAEGSKIPFSVLSAHVFMESEETEPLQQVEIYALSPSGRQDIAVTENEAAKSLDGAYTANTEGTHILCGHRKGMIWSKTTKGWKQESKQHLTGVISSGKYEKFAKTLVSTGPDTSFYSQPVGHKLEIVPLDNPREISNGDEIRFRILFAGKPLAAEVFATYDGFSTRPNTYAYYSSSDENGEAVVKISHPGIWMIRVQYETAEPTVDYDKEVVRAVLVFTIEKELS